MRALAALLLLSGPALAQDWEPDWEVAADLDGDGAAEVFRLTQEGEDLADLSLEAGGETRVVRGIAWAGGPGQTPGLSVNEAGSVVLSSMNDAVGRSRWRLDLTIAFRDGDWRVAGITYEWRDTLDPAAWGRCDLNLLSGRGEVGTEAGVREVAAPFPAPAIWDWAAVEPGFYGACGV